MRESGKGTESECVERLVSDKRNEKQRRQSVCMHVWLGGRDGGGGGGEQKQTKTEEEKVSQTRRETVREMAVGKFVRVID